MIPCRQPSARPSPESYWLPLLASEDADAQFGDGNVTIYEDVYGIEGYNRIETDDGTYQVYEDSYGIEGITSIHSPDGTITKCYEDVYGIDGMTKCY